MQDSLAFGQFVRQRRQAAGMSLRAFAQQLDVAPAYMSDIENGRRYAPDSKLAQIADLLHLTQGEREQMLDLAALTRPGQVPIDLCDYIMGTDMARLALRRARDAHLDQDGWNKILDIINATP